MKNKLILFVAIALIAVCLFSLIGVTYARLFTTIFSGPVNVTAHSNNAVYIYGNSLDESNINSEWKAVSYGWSQEDTGASLQFFVANGTDSESFSKRDQTYNIRLISGVGGEGLEVTLSYTDSEGKTALVESTSKAIAKGSPLYASNGEGWIYGFYDEDGKELTFELKGEELSYKNFVLTVLGTSELSLLNLQVVGEYKD
ncbi:MAG: hypothetical protein IJF69_03725 [Clostridia bacterium]|nr:hypothetical protein [Clostridia bacterium]